MSFYTVTVLNICAGLAKLDHNPYGNDIDFCINEAYLRIFGPAQWDVSEPGNKEQLGKKILRHYLNYEIGYETYAMWKYEINQKLSEIMPYYNELYQSLTLVTDPLDDVNYTRTYTGEDKDTANRTNTVTSNTTTNTKIDGTRTNAYSDTPQGSLTNVERGNYLTNASKATDNENNSTTGNGTTEQTESNTVNKSLSHEETIKGKQGTQSYNKLLAEYRQNIINIDLMIIDELKDQFLTLWG